MCFYIYDYYDFLYICVSIYYMTHYVTTGKANEFQSVTVHTHVIVVTY